MKSLWSVNLVNFEDLLLVILRVIHFTQLLRHLIPPQVCFPLHTVLILPMRGLLTYKGSASGHLGILGFLEEKMFC